MERRDVVVIGAGAAGMMCAIEAGRRGRSVTVLDHAAAPGEKIRISGGGRCNFTNLRTGPGSFLSANPHFSISPLSRYTQHDFIRLVDYHGIAWHEKTLGQLFCDGSSRQIVDMLVGEMRAAGVDLRLGTTVLSVHRTLDGFSVSLASGAVECSSLVVASGGKSIPKMGASALGYRIAEQFGLNVTETRPALVPLTFDTETLRHMTPLAGVAVPNARVACGSAAFDEALLFTHRGLSGPAILQISSYWREGLPVMVALRPDIDMPALLRTARTQSPRQSVHTVLSAHLPKRLALAIAERHQARGHIADQSDDFISRISASVNGWRLVPAGTEGYRTAEVTLGGVDTRELDQRSMGAKKVPGLHFIGEVVDVTGWLGGYNFQWAWSSGWCAGQAV